MDRIFVLEYTDNEDPGDWMISRDYPPCETRALAENLQNAANKNYPGLEYRVVEFERVW